MAWAENARIHDLRLAMWEWHGEAGTRACQWSRTSRASTARPTARSRAPTCVSAGLRPNTLAFQDLDAYAAAWRDALVKKLRAYKAMVDHCLSAVLELHFNEERCYD
jgi:hypothetical protein